jgi:LmbE family N-acetylglucosaminyl deacetylase
VFPLLLAPADRPLRLLALGAHCDDIEIAAGGTLLRLAAEVPGLQADLVVLSSTPERAVEFRASAAAFCAPAEVDVEVHDLPDGHLPQVWDDVKARIEALAARLSPDVILAPSRHDAHQDHRLLAEVVTTCFRDHLVLRYEIPKWDGDLGADRPSHYVPLAPETMQRKCELLREHYVSQGTRDWWSDETFRALGRIRGMECRAPYAEAFTVEKAIVSFSSDPS